MYKYIIDENQKDMRLDKALVFLRSDLSRTYIGKLIDESRCLVNGKVAKASYKLALNDVVEIDIPETKLYIIMFFGKNFILIENDSS